MKRRDFLKIAALSSAGTLSAYAPSWSENANSFIDAKTAELPAEIEASVCIVGAGAAGITLARTLAKTTSDVVLIESGGFSIEGPTQQLFSGKQLGIEYYNLSSCRLRYFGGTTNHWSGYCRANDQIDYEGRPELGLPSWPVNHDDLAQYIAEAGEFLDVKSEHFDPEALLRSKNIDVHELADGETESLETKVFQFANNLRFGTVYRDEMANAKNLRTYLHLNLLHVELSQDARSVTHIDCGTLEGKKVRVKAKYFVLCTHAIENARILLTSNNVATAGIGNEFDHVGRYFMDHTHFFASRIKASDRFPLIYNRHYAEKFGLNVNLSFDDNFTRQNSLLQYYCRFNPIPPLSEAISAAGRLGDGFMEPGSVGYLEDVMRVVSDPLSVAEAVRWTFVRNTENPTYFEMEHRLEQAPNRDSRVVISDRRDKLGSLIADLDWRLNEHDIRSFEVGQQKIAEELERIGYGTVELEKIDRPLVESRIKGHYHQIGTTRMSAVPSQGVVDNECKVHGVENLYIGGSSVFPTAGYSGPTMMIVAFALRLCDHLEGRLA